VAAAAAAMHAEAAAGLSRAQLAAAYDALAARDAELTALHVELSRAKVPAPCVRSSPAVHEDAHGTHKHPACTSAAE
jgi:hypothetical protein